MTLMADMQARNFPPLQFMPRDWSFWSQGRELIASFDTMQQLLIMSGSISIVAILETIISAKIADKMTKTKHNQEKEVF